jgi:hypothetical protein
MVSAGDGQVPEGFCVSFPEPSAVSFSAAFWPALWKEKVRIIKNTMARIMHSIQICVVDISALLLSDNGIGVSEFV